MTRIFLCATVITQGWNKYWNNSQCRKLALERKKILAASARTWSSNLLIVNLVLHTIELSLFPTSDTSLWRYITIPHLVTKGSAVPKISSGQTLFHLFCFFVNCCDFDLEHSNPILSLKTLAIKFIYLSYLPSNYTSGCQKIVRRYIVETVIFWWYKPSLSDLGLGDSNCTFSHNILLGNNDASPYQIWLRQVEKFRKYLLGKSWKDGHGWFQYTPLQWCTTQCSWNSAPVLLATEVQSPHCYL